MEVEKDMIQVIGDDFNVRPGCKGGLIYKGRKWEYEQTGIEG